MNRVVVIVVILLVVWVLWGEAAYRAATGNYR